jgi:hypothetical protein
MMSILSESIVESNTMIFSDHSLDLSCSYAGFALPFSVASHA